MLCNSWVITKDGKAIAETFNPAILALTPKQGVKVYTAYDWLCKVNADIRKGLHHD